MKIENTECRSSFAVSLLDRPTDKMNAFVTHDRSMTDGTSLLAEPFVHGGLLRDGLIPTIVTGPSLDEKISPFGLLPTRPSQADRAGSYLMSTRKRVMDICIASLVLLFSLPMLATAALAIKATSRGPVLFRQRRVGFQGAIFTVLKFRSMTYESCLSTNVIQATRNDLRVTKVGRFLRATSLDEFPQLINVLRGDMSLIGPRPHAVLHDQYYASRISLYQRRSMVRPGLTGLAQVNGARGETPQIADMERRVVLDSEYIRTASMLGDFRLLLLTAREILMSKTAL